MWFDDTSRLDSTIRQLSSFSYWPLLCLFGIGIIGHSFFLPAPFVNLEYVYHQSAEVITSGLGLKSSLLQLSEGFNNPLGNVVAIAGTQSVFGITDILNPFVKIFAIVSETPFIVIEPLLVIYFL